MKEQVGIRGHLALGCLQVEGLKPSSCRCDVIFKFPLSGVVRHNLVFLEVMGSDPKPTPKTTNKRCI